MIEEARGNLLAARVDTLVNTVNTVGVMGKGIALQFKRAYPANFAAYRHACNRGDVQPGRLFIFETGNAVPRLIVNFPTKRHWRMGSRLEDIDSGLSALVAAIRERGITSIAVPPLGCGNGGLRWTDVRPRIEKALAELPDVLVLLYAPEGMREPPISLTKRAKTWTRERAVFVQLLREYATRNGKVIRPEIDGLAYLLQMAGQPLGLEFSAEDSGLRARNLHLTLEQLEGTVLNGFSREMADSAEIGISIGADISTPSFESVDLESAARLVRINRLIDGFDTSRGLRLLTNVIWFAQTSDPSLRTVTDAMTTPNSSGNIETPQFGTDDITTAWERLVRDGWVVEGDAQV